MGSFVEEFGKDKKLRWHMLRQTHGIAEGSFWGLGRKKTGRVRIFYPEGDVRRW